MRIGLLGAGGVGATVAGAVAKDKNAEIVLIARGETKENVLKRGWILESEVLGDQVIHPALVSDDPAEIGTVDVDVYKRQTLWLVVRQVSLCWFPTAYRKLWIWLA